MIPLAILIVLYTATLTLAAVLNGEVREISFSSTLTRIVIEGLLIWWLVESFKYQNYDIQKVFRANRKS